MSGIEAFLAMGGYASYVWSAYGVALVVLGGLVLQSLRRYRMSLKALDELERRERRREIAE
jgi:heme exporter protein D